MEKSNELPLIDKKLIEKLNALFPEQSADLQWSERVVWYKAGQRSVVRFLIEKLKEQEEN